MSAYYNENDPFAAEWLRHLIAAGHIADGVVDERSILEVRADDLRGYTQLHLFSGVGVWSYALRQAGWADERPVATFSCPCQPFSAAGKGKGFDDERHLWPVVAELLREIRPPVCFGEQVASKDGIEWYHHVKRDMNAMDYSMAGFDMPACAFGSPHIRSRLYFVGKRNAG